MNTARRHKLGFAKLSQLVEIATNLKLAGCAQQGSGYVLPWFMGTGQEETAGGQEDDEGDVDPEVWGARPAGSFSEHDIERQVVAFHACRPSTADPVQDVFDKRAVELRPWPEQTSDADADGDTSDDEWTDDDDAPVSGDVTTERVYFTYGGGPDDMTPHTSVITDDVPSGGQASGTGRTSGRRRRRPHADEHEIERTPSGAGVRYRSPSELRTNDFYVGGSGGGLGDLSAPRQRGASLSDVALDDSDVRGHVETEEERHTRLDREEEERLQTLPGWDGRFAYMEEQRRRRELETGGVGGGDGGDMGFGGEADAGAARQGVPTGVERDGVPTGVEGDGGGEDEDEDEEGSDHGDDHDDDGGDGDDDDGGDHGNGGNDGDHDDYDDDHGDNDGDDGDDGNDGDDGDHDGDHDDEGRLALVLRDPSVPTPLTWPEAFAQAGFDAEELARLGSHDPFAHTGRRSDERRPPGGAYSPPPYIVDSPTWSGSSLSGIRGRESRPVEGGSGRLSDGGGSAGSMPLPPARSTEGGADATTAHAPVVGSPPPVAGGVAGGWAAHRRVLDQMRADYDAGRGAFAGRLSPRFQVAPSSEGGFERPSVHMVGRMLGLSRSATRRVLIPPPIPARGTAADMQQGQHYTSGMEGLLMWSGSSRHSIVTEVKAHLAVEIAAGQAALDAIQRQRQTIVAAEAEDEDADTESEPIYIAFRRNRASMSAAAAVAQATYISGAKGTGGGGGLRGARGRQSTRRGRGRPSGGQRIWTFRREREALAIAGAGAGTWSWGPVPTTDSPCGGGSALEWSSQFLPIAASAE
ncbi:hypothetical protein CBR_g17129 [Chara braunii]|uniref:Uncharacterized protein n=1 Tax=Chara braunii TaxID=69332 RepID=A0A388KUQ2_CHABU|nr:hypothetical protein CBR_g17129 [Chara braunii]|eukprot:GBG73790.1 hypothetical protein CBR_g17129 [Chara braunii]